MRLLITIQTDTQLIRTGHFLKMRHITDEGMNGYTNTGLDIDEPEITKQVKSIKQQEEFNYEMDYCRPKINGEQHL